MSTLNASTMTSDSAKLMVALALPTTAMLLKDSYREVINKKSDKEKKKVQIAIAMLGWIGILLLVYYSRKKAIKYLLPLVGTSILVGVYMTLYIMDYAMKPEPKYAFWLVAVASFGLGMSIKSSTQSMITDGLLMFALYLFTILGSLSPLKYNIYSVLAFYCLQLMAMNYRF